jgi:hypothetical protein
MSTFYLTITRDQPDVQLWSKLYREVPEKARYWLHLARRFRPNTLVARCGVWAAPWPMAVHPQLQMPAYDAAFNKTFSEVSDQRALEIRELIRQGKRLALFYSGGIDSTVCAVGLLKNLNAEELREVAFCCNINSATENPVFFDKFIRNRITVIDSNRTQYSDLIAQDYYPITADTGDDIFGTEQATQFYFDYARLVNELAAPGPGRAQLRRYQDDPKLMELPYAYFVDLLIPFLSPDFRPGIRPEKYDRKIGEWLYQKIVRNIETAAFPIYSLHDFFWWIIFNLRYTHCALRGPLFYYSGQDVKTAITKYLVNWFNTADYQRWSMANNNNGQKIRRATAIHYKWAARSYIYDFDRNDWYFKYKIKSVSLYGLLQNNFDAFNMLFALDSDYRLHWLSDAAVRHEFEEGLQNFQG